MVSENNHPPARSRPTLTIVRLTPEEDTTPWARVMNKLRELVGPGAFASWCKDIKLLHIAHARAVLGVPTPFLCHWLERHYLPALIESCRIINPSIDGVELKSLAEEARRLPSSVIRPPVTYGDCLPYQRRRGRARDVPSIIGMRPDRIGLMVARTPFLINDENCPQDIQLLVCSAYGLASEGLLLGLKPGRRSLPESLAIYLSMALTCVPAAKIGEIFGGMSARTVKYHFRKIDTRVRAGTLDAKAFDVIAFVRDSLKEAYTFQKTTKSGP